MFKYKRWMGGILLFPLILLFLNIGTAMPQSSPNYKIKKYVLDQAGAQSHSANHKVMDAVGQPVAIGLCSSANFSLSAGFLAAPTPPTITVTSPNGGETWIAGSTHDITWTSSSFTDPVKIEYSTDDGATWISPPIAANTPTDGSYTWTVPNTPSTTCKVRVADASDGDPSDVSDASFTISAPYWSVPIKISGAGLTFVRTFGGDEMATDGFDIGLDEEAVPPGMTYYAYFFISGFPNYLDTDIRGWVPDYETYIEWTLRIVNATRITSNLNWDPTRLPTQGRFTLEGGGLNVDMRTRTSAIVSGDATLTIQYRPEATVTYNFPQQGWYLISLPVTPSNNNLSVLFPTAMAAYGWDQTAGIYVSVTTLDPKKGYWLLFMDAASSDITGMPLNSFTEHYDTGWHLIGSVLGTDHPFADPDDNPDGSVISTYGWDPSTSTYYQVYPVPPGMGVLNEKEGYWLAVFSPCDLTIPGAPPFSKAVVPDETDLAAFYKQFGSKPPVPPFIADSKIARLLPVRHGLSQNYPNPFNPETIIEYSLLKEGLTRVAIYNTLGQRIRSLVDIQQPVGVHRVVWDGRDDTGELVPSGIYFYRIVTSQFVETKKMLLLR